jgi:hypothetical protein
MWWTLGGVTYDASRSDERTRRLAAAHWPELIVPPSEGSGVIRLEIESDPRLLDRGAPSDDVSVRRLGGVWEIERLDVQARLDSGRGQAWIRHGGQIPFLSSCLRVLTSLVLAPRGGILLHASSVHAGRGIVVFPGPSGTGKTTIARLGAPRGVLSDEVSAVTIENGAVRAHPTPFWGEMAREVSAGPGEVSDLVFVRSGAPLDRRRISAGDAVFRLLPNVLGFPEDDDHKREIVTTALALAQLVPAFEVTFRPPENPWRLLDGDGTGAS